MTTSTTTRPTPAVTGLRLGLEHTHELKVAGPFASDVMPLSNAASPIVAGSADEPAITTPAVESSSETEVQCSKRQGAERISFAATKASL